MFIAKCNNEAIGVVSLWVNDLKARQDLFPWMAIHNSSVSRLNSKWRTIYSRFHTS